MEAIREDENDALTQLLDEFGLSEYGAIDSSQDEGASIDAYLRGSMNAAGESSELEGDKQARILEKTERWLRFLRGRAEQLTQIAANLYQRLLASGAIENTFAVPISDQTKSQLIDRLEWTLAGLEYWIEEQKPTDDSAVFCVTWSGDDGHASWSVDGKSVTSPASLLAIVQDSAEVEGGFSGELSRRVADRVCRDLQSGDLQLMRLRRMEAETHGATSTFELIPNGEAYKLSLAVADESAAAIPPEIEACLTEESGAVLARVIDSAICGAAEAFYRSNEGGAISRSQTRNHQSFRGLRLEASELADLIDRAAEICSIRRADVVRCLFSVANYRLQASRLKGDHPSVVHYGGVLNCLAPMVLEEQRT